MDVLKLKLLENKVEFTEKLFKTEDGIDGISDQIFVGGAEIVDILFTCIPYRTLIPEFTLLQCIQAMPETSFAGYVYIYCFIYTSIPLSSHCLFFIHMAQAYREGIVYPKYLLITYGWYGNEWWKAESTSKKYNCSAGERASVLTYTVAPRVQESYTNLTIPDISGIVSYISMYYYAAMRVIYI